MYIDDTLVALICSEQQAAQPIGPDRVLLDKVHAAYAEASLPRAEEKGFGLAGVATTPPPVGSLNFTTWGTQVDSPSGVVGTPSPKRGYLMLLGFVVLTSEVLPFFPIEKYIALLVHPFTHRRECIASLHRVYKWLRGHDRKGLVTWNNAADVRDELWAATLLLSVAHANIRWPVSSEVSATDATPSIGGSVRVETILWPTLLVGVFLGGSRVRIASGKRSMSTSRRLKRSSWKFSIV